MKRIFAALAGLLAVSAVNAADFTIKNGLTSQVLDCVELYGADDDGATAEAGLDENTSGLSIAYRTNAPGSAAWTTYTAAGGTIEDITTSGELNTFETPTASHVRFEDTGGGCYQLQFEDAVWGVSGATRVTVKISDGGVSILDRYVTIEQGVVDLNELGQEVMDQLTDLRLDHLVAVADSDDVVDNSIIGKLSTVSGDWSNFGTAESLEGIRAQAASAAVDASRVESALLANLNSLSADSGGTTFLVDADLNQADPNYWAGGVSVIFTDGSVQGQSRCVASFTPGTDRIDWDVATTQAVSTNGYILVHAPACKEMELVDNAITAAKIGTDAIGADELAAGAANEVRDAFLDFQIEDDPATPIRDAYCHWNSILVGLSTWAGVTASEWTDPDGVDVIADFTMSGNDRLTASLAFPCNP